jgi:hypothetical protein
VRFHRRGANRFGEEHPVDHGRSRTDGTNGAHPAGMRTRVIPLNQVSEHDAEPVDLVAVQADDQLINALAAGMTVATSADGADGHVDDRVSVLLAAWKAEVDAEPVPELVDVDRGVAAVLAGRRSSHRMRHLAPIAAAAAFIVITGAGLSVGSYSAQPDDVLWPVAKVLYSERTESVEAADRVEQRIARAKQAIAAGQPAAAEQELRAAAADLAVVRPEEGRTELVDVQEFLVAKAGETPPGVPTDPGAPLASDQTRRVPPGAAISLPARTSEQSSTTDPATGGPGSTAPTSRGSGHPAAPVAPDPQLARVLPAPAPEPDSAGAPEVSVAPAPAPDTSQPEPETRQEQNNDPTSAPEQLDPPASAPEGEVSGLTADPQLPAAIDPSGSDSLGATAADSDPVGVPATS